MRIVIAGGHGQIALLTLRRLAEAGHEGIGIVRNPGHLADLEEAGGGGVVQDLETASAGDVAKILAGADALVFAAGAGPGSGTARKGTVDRGAAVLCAEAAEAAGVRRFVQVSSPGAGAPPRPGTDEVWAAYIEAKTAAEDDLRARDLDWTILRPGALTNAPATGRVLLSDPPVGLAEVTRDDVAAVLVALLDAPASHRRTLELREGDVPVAEAVAAL
ncbi:NAD(P)-binding oxidoreductase [Actinocorallia longicatena]|uniref:NAD(P)H-binding protein n=1 Tax=Actinocorallia longicatena TaxID=111803 RepID=A0ABP6QGF2_9ACTN